MHLLSFYFLLFFIQNIATLFLPHPPPPNYKPITFKEPSSDMVVWDRITKPILSYSIHSHLLHALNVCELGNATMYIMRQMSCNEMKAKKFYFWFNIE